MAPAGVGPALWRAVAVLRGATLAYAALLVTLNHRHYAHPAGGWVVLGLMAAWTAVTIPAYLRVNVGLPVLAADLAVSVLLLLSTDVVETAARIDSGAPTLTVTWVAVPVVAWALAGGWRAGGVAALLVAVADVAERGALTQTTFNGVVLLVLTGCTVGLCVELALRAEAAGVAASQAQAAAQERERLAAHVHDGTLQVLGLVRRETVSPELARLAAEQERDLRRLLAAGPVADPGVADLRDLLPEGDRVSVSVPAEPVLLPAAAAQGLAAAVAAALDNAWRHGGPGVQAWVLLDDEGPGGAVRVTVRDDGVGFAPGRLAVAVDQGRLGVAASVQGRLRGLGGTAVVTSAPGGGTEVELCLPR